VPASCYPAPVKILLVAVNAKYVQTNLAVRLLKAHAVKWCEPVRNGQIGIEIAEWNINQNVSSIIRGIFEARPDIVLFSTYIWNRGIIFEAAAGVRKVLPGVLLGFGGPEVSWSAERTFVECPSADLVFTGEGEESIAEFAERLGGSAVGSPAGVVRKPLSAGLFSGIRGLYVRDESAPDGCVFGGDRAPIADLDLIPFPYDFSHMDFDSEHRIVYYETSRGCPFSCAYCLSSIDKSVRYYSLERVLRELKGFMDAGFPLVKFVDRTFNLDPARFLSIWRFIRDNHNGKTLFHFEIAAEYLADEAFTVLESMPEGAIQLEIGIQSINPETLNIVGRPAHPDVLADKIRRIPERIHTHVDLIAGLPAEDFDSFGRSFDYAFALGADMLQLGFLKILSGSPMEALARDDSGFVWSASPPYEVFASPVLDYAEMLQLKDVEQVTDTWYNSGLMRNTLRYLAGTPDTGRQHAGMMPKISAFSLFRSLATHIAGFFVDGDLYLPRRPSDSFACMAAFLEASGDMFGEMRTGALEWLRYDLLLQGKPGTFPAWYERRYSKEAHDRALEAQGFFWSVASVSGPETVSRRSAYARTEYDLFRFDTGVREIACLFVYPDKSGTDKKVRVIRV